MKGLYNYKLKWPLKGEFEMGLLNQASDDNHHSETVYFDDNTPAEALLASLSSPKPCYINSLVIISVCTIRVH